MEEERETSEELGQTELPKEEPQDDNITLMRNFTIDEVNEHLNSRTTLDENDDVGSNSKKKCNKKLWLIIGGVIIFVLIVLVVLYFLFFKDKNEKTDNKDDSEVKEDVNDDVNDEVKYVNIFINDQNGYSFDGEAEPSYRIKCENEECEGLFVDNTYAVIKDGESSYIYNYQSGEKLIDDLKLSDADGIYAYLDDNVDGDSFLYGFLLKSTDNLYGVYNINEGGVTVPLQYKKFSSMKWQCSSDDDNKSLFVINDLLVFENDGKYGVIDTKNYKIVVDDEMECVTFGNSEELIFAYNNDKKTAYDDLGKKIFGGGSYDDIYFYTEKENGIGIVRDGNNIKILNKNGDLITFLAEFKEGLKISMVGFEGNEVSKKAYITLYGDAQCVEYYYDFITEGVTKLDLDINQCSE